MASHPIPQRLFGFAAKLEAAGGTAEVISKASDAIQLSEPGTLEWLAVEENRREGVVAGSLNLRPVAPGDPSGVYGRISWRVPLRGAGTAYAAANLPPADALLVAGGMGRTVDTTLGAETVAYDPTDDPNTGADDTVTMEVQTANREYIFKGGVTDSLRVEVSAGGIAYLVGSTLGIYEADSETALESHTYSTVAPAIWKNSGPLSVGGVTSIIGKRFVLDYQLAAAVRASPDADGIAGFKITGRQPSLRLTAETLAKATWDPEGDHRTSTQRAIDIVVGSAQYKRFDVDIDAAYVDSVGHIDEDELRHFEVDYAVSTEGAVEARLLFD